jgi:GIY-YIG catalytic domain-containing protein
LIPPGTRGIYALLKYRKKIKNFDVVYVGMTNRSIRRRLNSHKRSKTKGVDGVWTHFSIYEVWENIKKEEIEELEGLFRQIYRYDTNANKLNKQRGYKNLKRLKRNIYDFN